MSQAASKPQRVLRALAWAALILSFPVWGAALLVPFLPLPIEQRTLFAGVCIVAGELLFWGAGLYLGANVLTRLRAPKANAGESPRDRPAP